MAVKCKQKLSVVIVFIVLLAYPVQLQGKHTCYLLLPACVLSASYSYVPWTNASISQFTVDECQYKYTIQPPDQLDCNPYGQGFSLSCRVEGPQSVMFSVEWYRKSSTQTDPEKMGSVMDKSGSVDDSTFFIREKISLIDSDLQDIPTFWCQVVVAEGRLQRPSRKLTLQPPSSYSEDDQMCSLSPDQSVDEESCADLDPSPTPSLTPSPTTSVGDDGKPQSGGGGDDDDSLETALFSIIGVIAVFCIVIVTLAVTIVILYRKKVRRVRIKGAGKLMSIVVSCRAEIL